MILASRIQLKSMVIISSIKTAKVGTGGVVSFCVSNDLDYKIRNDLSLTNVDVGET